MKCWKQCGAVSPAAAAPSIHPFFLLYIHTDLCDNPTQFEITFMKFRIQLSALVILITMKSILQKKRCCLHYSANGSVFVHTAFIGSRVFSAVLLKGIFALGGILGVGSSGVEFFDGVPGRSAATMRWRDGKGECWW